ncbi:hypothetical protein SNEBB_005596 [Seison nebaliae]|nr:hypothetical protein SNEBB_005596 [Seison nebaliae]
MMIFQFILIILPCIWCSYEPMVQQQPQQIHLAYTRNGNEMSVTWITIMEVNDSRIEYGEHLDVKFPYTISNIRKTLFIDGGDMKRREYIYFGIMTNLELGKQYFYRTGSATKGWSSIYYFTFHRYTSAQLIDNKNENISMKLAIYGDMGNVNAQSLPRLQTEVQMNDIHQVLHVGDFAYDMADNNAKVGDEFMRQIESIAGYVPYMTCVGNHEAHYNFSNYAHRFSMPGNEGTFTFDNNLFHSYDVGPVHFVTFSTEFYFFMEFGWTQIQEQYEWLEADLKKAHENRDKVPWIITMGHRPMYCSDNTTGDCTKVDSIIRVGLPIIHAYGLEDLFYNYGVDIELYAHEHNYERLFPIYNYTMYKGSESEPYTDPKAPVHIITGSAGCQERHTIFSKDDPKWSAFRTEDYGYSKFHIFNQTHIHVQYISDDQSGKVVDDIWIIKHSHGLYDGNK